jgi:MbtH protein
MSQDATQNEMMYDVVMNHEEQYSIWPAQKEMPLGWTKVGMQGTKQACLDHIKEVWTDMRPLSLRVQMAAAQAQ